MSDGSLGNLNFDIDGTKRVAENLETINGENVENEKKFEDYIAEKIEKVWITENGKRTAEDLKEFLETDFKSYVDYLNGRIETLGTEVVHTLNEIDQA